MNNKPDCYKPEENNPYPLCVGNGNKECEECCLYAEYTWKESWYKR